MLALFRRKAALQKYIVAAVEEQRAHEATHPVETHDDVRELSVLQRLERRLGKTLDHDRRGRPNFPAWVVALVREEIARAW